jgi:diguanylate cyclase (GGDEF)-like protein
MASAVEHRERLVSFRAISGWAVWAVPRRVLAAVLSVEVVAVTLVALAVVAGPQVQGGDVLRTVILCGLALVHTEIVLGIERSRRRVAGAAHIDLGSIWVFGAVVALPPLLAVLVAVVVNTDVWLRHDRDRAQPHRFAFSTATIVLACLAASGVLTVVAEHAAVAGSARELLGIALAIGVYTVVNGGLVAGVIVLTTSRFDPATVFGHGDDNVLEVAALSLGAATAAALLVNPWLALVVLPTVLVLHRAVLLRQLEQSATSDGKTGLLNSAAWQMRADGSLRRRGAGSSGVLLVDLDHFKAVNDEHGHLVGDRVLVAVADALRAEVRDHDSIGRFGGEEFVVLLDELGAAGPAELTAVGERIRQRIESLRVEVGIAGGGDVVVTDLTVSIGGAASLDEHGDLQDLLQIADTALYSVKRSGRNGVRIGLARGTREPKPAGGSTVPALDRS